MIDYLSRRQREVLILKANGNTDREIGVHLGISQHAVSEILARAYRKLGANIAAQAVAIALSIGEIGVHQIVIPDTQKRKDLAA